MSHLAVSDIISSEKFDAFYQAAEQFSSFVENDFTVDSDDYLRDLHDRLVILYETAMNVPWIDLQSASDYRNSFDKPYIQKVVNSIADNLQDKRYYWDVSNPIRSGDKQEVMKRNLVDDVGNIFKAIKYSLNIFNSGKQDSKEVALWQFKFDFEYHWGSNCINAIRALHFHILK